MRKLIVIFLVLASIISCKSESVIDEQWLDNHYSKTEVMIPMRDGISLFTSVYHPLDTDDAPILLVRTPYSCAPYGDGWKEDLTEYMTEFLSNRYIICLLYTSPSPRD